MICSILKVYCRTHSLMFQQWSFVVVCLEGGAGLVVEQQNLLCGSGCVRCGKAEGMLVASSSPLLRGFQHVSSYSSLVGMDAG